VYEQQYCLWDTFRKYKEHRNHKISPSVVLVSWAEFCDKVILDHRWVIDVTNILFQYSYKIKQTHHKSEHERNSEDYSYY
jgi:hypothetical protein